MLNNSVCYPYPVLREDPLDFTTSVFHSDLDVLREVEGFRIVPNFSVNDIEVENMINSGQLSYALQIECRSTWYRDMRLIKNNENIILPAHQLHQRVDIQPCIIAVENINNYCCTGFADWFKGISYNLKKNDVVGIGDRVKFNAIYKSDLLKKPSSIVQVKVDDSINSMKVKLDDKNFIYVYLPTEQWNIYKYAGGWTEKQKHLTLGLICTPAIVYALTVMEQAEDEDENEYEGYAWYRSLLSSVTALANGDPNKVKILLEDPVNTAQLLLDNNSRDSLDYIESMG